MPIGSYLKDNDYRPYTYKPYQLPYAAALQEQQAKQSYWDQGLQRINNEYSQLTGLNLTSEKYKEEVKSFISNVKGEMNKLVNSDLSESGNVGKIKDILKPIIDNEDIKNDHYQTSRIQQSLMDVEKSKTENKGANYNPAIEKLLRHQAMEYSDFLNNPEKQINPNSPNKPSDYQLKYSYRPGKDYTSELKKAYEMCPENKTTNVQVGNNSKNSTLAEGYLRTTSTNTKNVADCIHAYLSDDAKQMMYLEGSAAFLNNEGALFEGHLKNREKQNRNLLEEIVGVSSLLKNEKDLTPEQISQYTDYKERLNKLYNTNTTELNDLTNQYNLGDYSYIKKNYDNIAGMTYFSQKLNDYKAFNGLDQEEKIDADRIAELYISGEIENQLANAKFTNEANLERYKMAQAKEIAIMGMTNEREISNNNNKVDLIKAGIDPLTGKAVNNGKGNITDINNDGIPDNEQLPFTSTITDDLVKTDNSFKARVKELNNAFSTFNTNKTEYLMALVNTLDLGSGVETKLKEIAKNNGAMSKDDFTFVNNIINQNKNSKNIGLDQRRAAYEKSVTDLRLVGSAYDVSKEELRSQMSTKTDPSLKPFGFNNQQEVFDAYMSGKIKKNPNYGLSYNMNNLRSSVPFMPNFDANVLINTENPSYKGPVVNNYLEKIILDIDAKKELKSKEENQKEYQSVDLGLDSKGFQNNPEDYRAASQIANALGVNIKDLNIQIAQDDPKRLIIKAVAGEGKNKKTLTSSEIKKKLDQYGITPNESTIGSKGNAEFFIGTVPNVKFGSVNVDPTLARTMNILKNSARSNSPKWKKSPDNLLFVTSKGLKVFFKGIPSSSPSTPGIYSYFTRTPDGQENELTENQVIQLSKL